MKLRHILAISALAILCWSATSCTITTKDGSASVDPAGAVEFARVIYSK